MRILILDDNLDVDPKIRMVKVLNERHVLTLAKTVEEAKSRFDPPFDLLLLDHDLEGVYEKNPDHPNTGLAFVRWLVQEHRNCPRTRSKTFCPQCQYPKAYSKYGELKGIQHVGNPQVLLHSQNEWGRVNMRAILERCGFDVEEYPFGPSYVGFLKRIS